MNEKTNQPLPLKNSITGGMTFSLGTIVYFVVSLICSSIILGLALESGSDASTYINYLAAPIAIAATVAIICRVRHVPIRDFVPVKCHVKYYVIALLLAFGLLFSLNWLNEVTVNFFKLFGYTERGTDSYLPNLEGGYLVLAILVMAVLPAFFEELLFRGAILKSIEGSVGSIVTIFLVGFCFSIFHGSPEQTAYQFVCGCIFAFLVIRSNSILPAVLVHFLNNAVILVLYSVGAVGESGDLLISFGANIALIVVSALCLIGGIVWLILDKGELKKGQKGEVKNFFIYASVGIALMLVIWICNLVGVS